MQNVYQTKYGKAASRRRILNWINNNLRTSFMRIEDLRSGVEYCLMLHKLKPSAIKLKQVFMNPRTHYEYVHNMRLLQKSLFKQGVEKQIPIQRLVSRGNLENLEFAQWFKAFYDLNYKLLRDEKLLRDDQYSVIDVMKTGVKPQAKFDEMPESFVDTEQSRNESRCRHYSRSISRHSDHLGKNIENYQKCECGSYIYSKTTRRNPILKSRDPFRMAHSLYYMIEAVNTTTAHINSTLNTIRRFLIRENPDVCRKVFPKKYRILNSRLINKPTRLMTKRRYLQNKQANWQVGLLKSENQNSETSPSKDEPGIFLDVEDPSISRTHKIDVTDEEPGNEPDLFRSPQSISTQILDDLSSSFDNLSDKEQDSLGPELHYSSSADEWSLNSDEGCTTDRNPKSISTQIVKDSDDVPLSHNLETFSANAEDQSIHKAEMGKQAIMADDLGSDFDRASDKEQFSLGPELYYSSADEELSLRSLEECTTDRCFSYNNLNSLFRNPESISTQIVEDFGAGLTTKSVPLDDDAPVFFNLETISANEKELGEQFTLRHDILKAETDKQTKPADDLSSSFDNLSDQEQFSLGPELHYSSSADEWSLKSDEGCTTDRNPESITAQIVKNSDDVPLSLNLETFSAYEEDQSTSRHDIHKAKMDEQAITADDLGSDFNRASDKEQFSLGPELYYSSAADELSLSSLEADRCFSDRNLYSSTNNNWNYSEDSSTLFQNELETDMPIPFAIVRSKSQSSHENISENTIPINVIDFQKYRNPSNICNSANSSTTDELSQKKMDPKRCNRSKNSNGKLLRNRLAHVFYQSRHFKYRSIGGCSKQKNVKIKCLKYLVRNLKVGFRAISAVEECSCDDNSDVGDLRQNLACVLDNFQKNLKNFRKILKSLYRQKKMREEINYIREKKV
ncbi:uncharacterized protein LOC6542622 [Drosophila erecta]|uniref:uncharacterized protein LOC6542622 n=1 Tax=Drosophila erecta TaxID=7220 RepID=UPI000177EFEF|nr:uncharacterized protein LOC6542622 [Drosophila erecta]